MAKKLSAKQRATYRRIRQRNAENKRIAAAFFRVMGFDPLKVDWNGSKSASDGGDANG